MGKQILIFILLNLIVFSTHAQQLTQTVKGFVTDRESQIPLAGANITELNSSPPNGAVTDAAGRFRLKVAIGRISLKVSFLGYEDVILKDILVASGKEVDVEVALEEKIIRTSDVIIRSERDGSKSINQMATISTNTIRTADALRYAGGFYDPSRIVNAFAGVITSNNDYSNDIVIRGNSSRGLLWRLEGIEIPNPNHFSDGQGGSGGAFSAITSNVIANFDFFTGAFPAEFGNAVSGVMDLNLRKGNPDKHEYAFQTGMIGAEIAMEGPFSSGHKASFLINARYTNFKILSDLNLIDLGESNYAPRTRDLVYNINIPFRKRGTLNLFGLFGSSELGKIADPDIANWTGLSDRWEETEKQSSGTAGIKYLYIAPSAKTYVKAIAAYTTFSSSYSEGYVDSSLVRDNSYYNNYNFPSFRSSVVVNNKLNSRNSLRSGFNYNYLSAEMGNFQRNNKNEFDTLVGPSSTANMFQVYTQWKYHPFANLEINTGIHILESSPYGKISVEPRLGIRWQVAPGNSFIAGFGVHSRAESPTVYNSLIKDVDGIRRPLNRELDLSKAAHFVAGADFSLSKSIRLRIEAYLQNLYNIPIVNKLTSQYSTINSSERLPEALLENEGTGKNSGFEITLEKAFTKNYYFLLTGSLFDSWYKAGDQHHYNTYYNTKYVSNFMIGKDLYVGKNKRNTIGMNLKYVIRGGYRYTPVDRIKSLKSKKIIYLNSATYEGQLPDFMRLDAGINFRKNQEKYSWIVMLDIQNAGNRKNVFRRRFTYENGQIISNDVLSLGMVPVFNFRVEF